MANKSSRRVLWHVIRRNKIAYIYIAPFYILFIIFGLFPIVSGLALSFYSWDGAGPFNFVGFKNYIDLFKTKLFWKSLSNTAFIGIIGNFIIMTTGIILAYILNSKLVRFQTIFKTQEFICLPHYAWLRSKAESINKAEKATFMTALDELVGNYAKQLNSDVDEFCDSFDYRNAGKLRSADMEHVRSSVNRSIYFLTGRGVE